MIRGVPTINGYSGNEPPHYPLRQVEIAQASDRKHLRYSLVNWCKRHKIGMDKRTVQWISNLWPVWKPVSR